MEALFENGADSEALALIIADGDHSWKQMINSGTTILGPVLVDLPNKGSPRGQIVPNPPANPSNIEESHPLSLEHGT